MKNKFKALFAFLGIDLSSAEETPHGLFMKEDGLTKMDELRTKAEKFDSDLKTETDAKDLAVQNLTTITGERDTLKTQLDTAKTDLTAANTKVTEKDAEILTLQEDKKELQAKIANKPYKRLDNQGGGGGNPTPGKKMKSVELAASQVD